jgi:hypothetical protein
MAPEQLAHGKWFGIESLMTNLFPCRIDRGKVLGAGWMSMFVISTFLVLESRHIVYRFISMCPTSSTLQDYSEAVSHA